jgi:hypothetical protein
MDVATFVDWVMALTFAVSAWMLIIMLGTITGAFIIGIIKSGFRRREP